MSEVVLGHSLLPPQLSSWVQLALATPVVWWGGWPFFQRAWASLVHRSLNMFTLISMGTAAAWGFSVFATLAPHLVPQQAAHGDMPQLYFEASAVIVTLVLLGQVLELRVETIPKIRGTAIQPTRAGCPVERSGEGSRRRDRDPAFSGDPFHLQQKTVSVQEETDQ